MKFKAYIFLCLIFAILFISSTVVAEKIQVDKESNEDITKADDAKEQDQYGGGWGGNGGYGGGWGGSGGGYGGGGGGWGGRGGGWGGGGGGGRGCQWGCCGYNRWGGCRCCYTAQEARAYMDTLAKP